MVTAADKQVGQLVALGRCRGRFTREPFTQVIATTGRVILTAQVLDDLGRRAGLGGAGQTAAYDGGTIHGVPPGMVGYHALARRPMSCAAGAPGPQAAVRSYRIAYAFSMRLMSKMMGVALLPVMPWYSARAMAMRPNLSSRRLKCRPQVPHLLS